MANGNRAAKQQKREAVNAAESAASSGRNLRARVRDDARNAGALPPENDVEPPDMATLPHWHPDAVQDRFLNALREHGSDGGTHLLADILRKVAHESRQGVSLDRAFEIVADEIDAEAEAANHEPDAPEFAEKEETPENAGNVPATLPKP